MEKTKSLNKIGILGFGEVGQAVAKLYNNPKIKDLNRNDDLGGIDILHICIPWSEKFLNIVIKEIKYVKPKLTIIHSTVIPGTTKKIIASLPQDISRMIVHSPVRGVHPNLYEGIKTFVKYIGAEDSKSALLAENHLKELQIKTKVFIPSATTELAKILDTTYYGVCIAWHGEMKKICDKLGVNFDEAVTDFNKSYNKGYVSLGKTNVVRPILSAPKGKIGGHCVIPNALLLKKYYRGPALELILKYVPKRKKK